MTPATRNLMLVALLSAAAAAAVIVATVRRRAADVDRRSSPADGLPPTPPAPARSADGPAQRRALGRIPVVRASVLDVRADVVVNAANERMAGGAGSNGAILARAGADRVVAYNRRWPDVLRSRGVDRDYSQYEMAFDLMRTYKHRGGEWERSTVLPSPTFGAPGETILHAVGPDFRDATSDRDLASMYDRLRKTYDNIYETAARISSGPVTLALLPISGGIYMGTVRQEVVLAVMLEKAKQYRRIHPQIKTVVCLFMAAEWDLVRRMPEAEADFEFFDGYDAYALAQNM